MALDLFLQKFEDKGIFEQWVGLDLPGTKAAPDFKYPYVTKLDGETGNICCFIGDLHGDVHSLLRTLWRLGALGFIDKNFKITKKNFYLIFLGDYVDRGRYGAEVFYTLMRLKCAKWGQVYLNRGNHEVKGMNERRAREGGGFRNELEIKYQEESDNLFAKICDIYQRLPLSVYITANGETVQAVHAGFGPYNYYYDKQMKQLMTQKNKRYRHIPLEDMDLISPAYQWCDVSQQMHVGAQNIFREDNGRVWNIDIATLVKRLEQVGIRALFRGHQHGSYGLKMLFSPAEYLRLADKESSVDKSSSHYHWSRVLSAEDIAANRLGSGFKISKYMPLFTFSSSPEGVGELYDCFGLLFIDGLYDDWRLKVYEFETAHDDVSYTSISPAMRRLPTTGTGDVLDPVRVTFNNEPEAEEKLKKSLDRIGTQQELIE